MKNNAVAVTKPTSCASIQYVPYKHDEVIRETNDPFMCSVRDFGAASFPADYDCFVNSFFSLSPALYLELSSFCFTPSKGCWAPMQFDVLL